MAEMTNRQVEDAAIRYVLEREEQAGRTGRDTRGKGAAGDLECGDRVIEVKAYGTSARGSELWLEDRQVQEASENPNFHLYVVENVRQGDPQKFTLLDIHGEELRQLLSHKKRRSYYTVPFGTAIYDRLHRDALDVN
jgi:hypothetical protein